MKDNEKAFNFLIYDEIEVIRKGLEKIITDTFVNSNVVSAKTYEEIIELNKVLQFDLHIIGNNSTNVNEILSIRRIKRTQVGSKILVLSNTADIVFMNKCLYNGALGYATKSLTEEELLKAISVILKGNDFFSNDVRLKLAFKKGRNVKQSNEKIIDKRLSKREFQLAQMLVNGENNISISKKLKLAMSTISTYKKRVMIKTKANNILELAEIFRHNDPVKLAKKY